MINQLFFDSDYDAKTFLHMQSEEKTIAHYQLPSADISVYSAYVAALADHSIDYIVVIGIGGSSLGAQAVYDFLKSVRNFKRILYFLDSTNPVDIRYICSQIDFRKTHFIVVSKSGTTIETIAIYKYLLGKLAHLKLAYNPFTIISDESSALLEHARKTRAFCFAIKAGISGRFSVLSAVGLVPLALVGVDIKTLLLGAKEIKESFFNDGYMQETLLKKATYYAKHSTTININTLFSYSQSLISFNDWYVQLWGESLGKKQIHSNIHVGLTPIGLIGPKDQHSFLQLLAAGKRDKSVTFILLKTFNHLDYVPNISLENFKMLDYLNDLSFAEIVSAQAEATISVLSKNKQIPIDVIHLSHQNELSIGKLIYYFELLTSLLGCLLGVNAYDQPNVETVKNILNAKLKKIHQLRKKNKD